MTTTTTATAKTTTGRTSLIAERVMQQVYFLVVQKLIEIQLRKKDSECNNNIFKQ